MLDRARRRARDDRSHGRRSVRGNDHAGRACTFCAAANGAEVPWVGHLVETDDQRALFCGKLPGVAVFVRLAPGDDALMIARPGRVVQLALQPELDARALDVPQPRLGSDRTLGRPELEHLSPAAQRLAHGATTVHLVANHFGTSW